MDISGLLLLYCKSPDYFFIFVFRYKGLIVMENENKAQVKEPVKIRFKELKNGNQSIYLYIYVNGVREYEFLSIYLKPEKTRADKLWNKEQIRLANAVKAERIISIQNGEFGFKDLKRTRKLNFIQYLEKMAETYEANGQTACGVLMRSAIRRLVDYKGKVIPFSAVTKEYLIGFIDYLNNEKYDFDKKWQEAGRQTAQTERSVQGGPLRPRDGRPQQSQARRNHTQESRQIH